MVIKPNWTLWLTEDSKGHPVQVPRDPYGASLSGHGDTPREALENFRAKLNEILDPWSGIRDEVERVSAALDELGL